MICDGDKKNLLLSPPGPQLLLQTLQVPHTPHWHSELDGGADGPAGVGIDSGGINCNYSTFVLFLINTIFTLRKFQRLFSDNEKEHMCHCSKEDKYFAGKVI